MRKIMACLTVVTLGGVACGDDGSDTAANCESTVRYEVNTGFENPTEIEVEVLDVAELGDRFTDEMLVDDIVAQGRHFGINYELENVGATEVHLPSGVFGSMRVSDESRSWPAAQNATMQQMRFTDSYLEVIAGSSSAAWAVFDVPTDAEPIRLEVTDRRGDAAGCIELT